MNRLQSAVVASVIPVLCVACGNSGDTAPDAVMDASTTSQANDEVSTGNELTSGPVDATGSEATTGATGTTSTGDETSTSETDAGSTDATGSTSESTESSGTTGDPGPSSCADAADVVNVWSGRAALSSELDDPILVPGSFPSTSLVVAVANSSFACADIGEYPCGQAGDAPPHEKLVIFLPEGQEAGTFEVGWPPQSDAPAVLTASTSGFPPACSAGGSGFSWETGVLELTSIDETSIEGVFCNVPESGASQAWTFAVSRC